MQGRGCPPSKHGCGQGRQGKNDAYEHEEGIVITNCPQECDDEIKEL
jgi:hypothetical protein